MSISEYLYGQMAMSDAQKGREDSHTFVIGLLCVVLAGTFAACGGGGGGGGSYPTSPSTPQYPNVIGVFQNGVDFFSSRITFNDYGGLWLAMDCAGEMTINSQSGTNFSGSFIYRTCYWREEGWADLNGSLASSDPVSGVILGGQIRMDGGLNFTADAPGQASFADLWATYGCIAVAASTQYNGALTSNNLQASATVQMWCIDFGSVSIYQYWNGFK